jgi:hypothetical protein
LARTNAHCGGAPAVEVREKRASGSSTNHFILGVALEEPNKVDTDRIHRHSALVREQATGSRRARQIGYDAELSFRAAELTIRLADLTIPLAKLTGCVVSCALSDAMTRSSSAPRRAVAPRSATSTSRSRPTAIRREIGPARARDRLGRESHRHRCAPHRSACIASHHRRWRPSPRTLGRSPLPQRGLVSPRAESFVLPSRSDTRLRRSTSLPRASGASPTHTLSADVLTLNPRPVNRHARVGKRHRASRSLAPSMKAIGAAPAAHHHRRRARWHLRAIHRLRRPRHRQP